MQDAHGALSLPLRALSGFRSWYASLSPAKQTITQDAFIWAVAVLCVWWVTRGVSFEKVFKTLKDANFKLFIGVNIGSFFLWWLGDTFLFSLLFTFFHKRTTPYELLPATAAQYFLQAVNQVAADGALVVFLNRRKGVKWLTATWTMMFQGLIDALCLSGVAMLAGLLVPHSAIRFALPYAGGAFGFLLCVALWWAWGKPKTRLGKWIYQRPSAHAFRKAGMREYGALGAIRLSMMIAQAFLYYYAFIALAPKVPLVPVLALTPAMQASFNQPITPAGLGVLQEIVVLGLSRYAPGDKIVAAALGISIMHLLCRLPLGFGAAGTFARRVVAIEASGSAEQAADKQAAAGAHVPVVPKPGT